MLNNVVIGAGFGDEGKGQTVSNIIAESSNVPFVVRFNGGHQAGHTVEYNGIRHVFSNFGAGTLQGVPTYWSRFCTVNPSSLRNEFAVLKEKGITPELWIDPLSPVTLPHDIISNRENAPHGTVGVGFGETIKRNEAFYKLFAIDLTNSLILEQKLESIIKNYFNYLHGTYNNKIEDFLDDVVWLLDNPNIHITRPDNLMGSVFEGAQGILLDQDFGFFPHVTRSKTTTFNVNTLINELHIGGIFQVTYVTRAYHTRHGTGPFNTSAEALLELKNNILETNVTNEFQGEFRKTILDMDLLSHAIKLAEYERQFPAKAKVIVTCLEHHKENDFYVYQNGALVTKFADSLERELNNF